MPTKALKDGTSYEKAVHHTEKLLRGTWDVSIKIDGVRAMRNAKGEVVSRNSKPLYNLDHLQFMDAEIFRDDWATSVSLVRTQSYKLITQDDVYELGADLYDARLHTHDVLINSTYEERMDLMETYVAKGYEGIVLRHRDSDRWVKVVPVKTADVRVTGYKMGTGKYAGLLGSFETAHGSVGSGLSDADRKLMTDQGLDTYVGHIIEVQFRETTEAGKLRFPAYVRTRFDKDEESLT